jgi:hypothetical protein
MTTHATNISKSIESNLLTRLRSTNLSIEGSRLVDQVDQLIMTPSSLLAGMATLATPMDTFSHWQRKYKHMTQIKQTRKLIFPTFRPADVMLQPFQFSSN